MDRRFASSETTNSTRKEDWEDSEYSQEFVKKVCELEKLSHGQENPEKLAMNALKAANKTVIKTVQQGHIFLVLS